MIIQRTKDEVIFRVSGNLNVDDLQDMPDFFECKEISKKWKATQEDIDNLVKSIKKIVEKNQK